MSFLINICWGKSSPKRIIRDFGSEKPLTQRAMLGMFVFIRTNCSWPHFHTFVKCTSDFLHFFLFFIRFSCTSCSHFTLSTQQRLIHFLPSPLSFFPSSESSKRPQPLSFETSFISSMYYNFFFLKYTIRSFQAIFISYIFLSISICNSIVKR